MRVRSGLRLGQEQNQTAGWKVRTSFAVVLSVRQCWRIDSDTDSEVQDWILRNTWITSNGTQRRNMPTLSLMPCSQNGVNSETRPKQPRVQNMRRLLVCAGCNRGYRNNGSDRPRKMKSLLDLQHAWCQASGQELNPKLCERVFYEAWKADVTGDDIRCVVEFMLRFNKRSDGAKFRLNAFTVVGDLEKLGALIAEARAAERNRRPAPTAKEQVVQLRERVVEPETADPRISTPVRTFKDVLKALENQ